MPHRRAVALMVLVTLLWSIAGVVTRHLDAARSFEVTFWRSLFTALTLAVALTVLRGPALWSGLLRANRWLWLSGLCWATMFTAFMLALTLTSVANVLVTMALGPLATAVFARLFLHHPLPARTWAAIVAACLGIAWMFGGEAGDGLAAVGTLVACAVPLAGAANWTVLQRAGRDGASDMLPAVLVGAVVSALFDSPARLAVAGIGARSRLAGAARQRSVGAALPVGRALEPRSAGAGNRPAGAARGAVRRCLGLALGRRTAVVAHACRRPAGAGGAGRQRSYGVPSALTEGWYPGRTVDNRLPPEINYC